MKLNRIVAAATLAAAAAGPAMASIALPSTGNGEFFLVVWDSTDQVSYVRDLGIFMDAWTGTSSLAAIDLNDSYFTSFLGIADNTNSTFDDLRFAVIAGDNVGTTSRRLFTTIDGTTTLLNNTNLTNAVNYLVTYQNNQAVVSANTGHVPADDLQNGQSYDIVGNNAYFLAQNGPRFNNAITASWTNSVAINNDALFRNFSSNGLPGGNQTQQSNFDGVWRVSNAGGVWQASYTVTPIPEAEGIAMMAAGLGALGFVARRRRYS